MEIKLPINVTREYNMNAVLIAGNIKTKCDVIEMCEKYFTKKKQT